ncbi:hypothetical protein DASC09_006750 [Saccharomycopsis crataegensis]|uniref:SPIN90/Ldb17 leucine-rich domain-containing protein n=1 Tax=Saccharomycopsis crataegensis TaxID=43959 RepID=A0AAV5QG09_9ASCO|nr:hypothetical protein DASC09_006750 [Saccharomycopsis crataegensis]
MNLDKSQYNINSSKEFYGFLETYLLSLDQSPSFDQANSNLVFFLSFVALYIDTPSDSNKNSFSIILSRNPEHILYRTSRILVKSKLFSNNTTKTFLISKLLSMLNLNVHLSNINLKLFLGFVFINLIKKDDDAFDSSYEDDNSRNGRNDAEEPKFNINDIRMDEDENGNNISSLNDSVIDILKSYSSFKIFFKILYFNNFINIYSKPKKSVKEKKVVEAGKNGEKIGNDNLINESLIEYEDISEHCKFIEEYNTYIKGNNRNLEIINYDKSLQSELVNDEDYFIKICYSQEKALLNPDTSKDLDRAFEALSEFDLSNPKSTDNILQKIIDNDSEFKSIIYRSKKIILSKIYMKLISNFLKFFSLTFDEIMCVSKNFVIDFLLKNLSIFEADSDQEDQEDQLGDGLHRRASVNKRGSVRFDNGIVFNDNLSKDLIQFGSYKKFLVKSNKSEIKNLNELKFELLLLLNEQYMAVTHLQKSLQQRFEKNTLGKLLYYKHLKLIQIKTEINSILNQKLQINENLQKTFEAQYGEELSAVEKLQAEQEFNQKYYGVNEQVEYSVDTTDLYEKVSSQFKDEFDKLTTFENNLQKLKELFETNEFFSTGDKASDQRNLHEFLTILRKDNAQAQLVSAEDLNLYLKLKKSEIFLIIGPKLQNNVFDCLIGAHYFDKSQKTGNKSEIDGSLESALRIYVNFVGFLIYSFNRQTNNCNKILILKMLYLILKEMKRNREIREEKKAANRRSSIFNPGDMNLDIGKDPRSLTSSNSANGTNFCEFYLNDLKVLVDIFIRELYNLSPETQLPVINNYLRVFFLLLDITPLNYLKFNSKYKHVGKDDMNFNYDNGSGYKRKEILELLVYLSDYNINELAKKCYDNDGIPPDILASEDEKPSSTPETQSEDSLLTRKLARKCLCIGWLGLSSYIVDKAFQLYGLGNINDSKFSPNAISRTSTASSSSSSIFNNTHANSADRMTLSKKLSNLRITNNNTGGSTKSAAHGGVGVTNNGQPAYQNTASPISLSPAKIESPSGYGVGSPNEACLSPYYNKPNRASLGGSLSNPEVNISRRNNISADFNTTRNDRVRNGLQKEFYSPTFPDSSHSQVSLPVSTASSSSRSTRKKPPPPPPPSASPSRSSRPSPITEGKRLPPPPPPPSRKMRVIKSAVELSYS